MKSRAQPLLRALIIGEVEESIAPDRTTHAAAILIPLEWRRAKRLGERIAREGFAVAEILKRRAVHTVRARFRHRLDHSAHDLSELRVVAVGNDLDFRDRVRRGYDHRRTLNGFVVIDAIDLPVAIAVALAVDSHAEILHHVLDVSFELAGVGKRAGEHGDEAAHVAAQRGDVGREARRNHGAQFRFIGLQQRRAALHGDLVGEFAHLQFQIQTRDRVDVHGYVVG